MFPELHEYKKASLCDSNAAHQCKKEHVLDEKKKERNANK